MYILIQIIVLKLELFKTNFYNTNINLDLASMFSSGHQ